MLDHFAIQGFRCFRDFKISDLKRLNLIAGRNGVGKSALLEAMQFYLNPQLRLLGRMAAWRDDSVSPTGPLSLDSVLPLFGAHLDQTPPLRLKLEGGRALELIVGMHRSNQDQIWSLVEDTEDPALRDPESRRMGLRLEEVGAGTRFIYFLDGRMGVSVPPDSKLTSGPSFYLKSESLSPESMSKLFEDVAGTDVEDQVNLALRWIVPDAERLLTKGSGVQRSVYLKRRGTSGPEPLKRFGDGTIRLAGLALTLANCRNGYCLIDEIENGIHYELFDRLWEKLALMSKAFNVQVFATTHSKDCIEAFERAYRLPEFDASYYRLERVAEDITSVRLDNETFFSVVAGQEHEVR